MIIDRTVHPLRDLSISGEWVGRSGWAQRERWELMRARETRPDSVHCVATLND